MIMYTYKKITSITAPVETVFDNLTNAQNFPLSLKRKGRIKLRYVTEACLQVDAAAGTKGQPAAVKKSFI